LLGEIAMTTKQRIQWDPVNELILNNAKASKLLTRSFRSPWRIPTI